MQNKHPYTLSQIPTHAESVDRQGEFEFGLYKCLVHKSSTIDRIDRHCLIIGYVNESPKKYVVVENSSVKKEGTTSIKIRYVKKEIIEEGFKISNRPQRGVLKYPKRGDKVFCLAKERYQGAEGGEIYTVQSMDGGRVDVHSSDYTYEPHYFAVITSELAGSTVWPGKKIKEKRKPILDVTSGASGSGATHASLSNYFVIGDNAETSTISITNTASFREFVEDDDIRKVEILEEGELLVRERSVKEDKMRIPFHTETINRQVNI